MRRSARRSDRGQLQLHLLDNEVVHLCCIEAAATVHVLGQRELQWQRRRCRDHVLFALAEKSQFSVELVNKLLAEGANRK
jgi:hypothetical protein